MKLHTCLLLIAVLALFGAAAAAAETPTVCDMESGAAYGLCTAYCEAMDCELAQPSASQIACDRVRDKFIQFTGRDLPCQAGCPCNDPDVFSDWVLLLAGEIEVGFCESNPQFVQLFSPTNESLAFAGFFLEVQRCGVGSDLISVSTSQKVICQQELEQAAALWSVTCTDE